MIKPRDFLDQAYRLVDINNSPSEVDCRSSVSRAYYSLFHEARDFLKSKGKFRRVKKGPHNAIKNTLYKIDKNMGLEFDNYRAHRTNADYDIGLTTFPFQQSNSLAEVKAIDGFIKRVKSLNI